MSLLEAAGYSDVRYYAGGLERWQQEGLSLVVEGRTAPANAERSMGREAAYAFVEFVERTSTLRLFALWFALILVSGLLFSLLNALPGHGLSAGGRPLGFDLEGLVTSIYFSFVTATSVGFGDVVPNGLSRILAVFEAAMELLVFGAVISKFVSRRQEELVANIHRLTFEERLSRLQTNLHLMLSEFQAISVLCSRGDESPERIQARVLSAARVFAGELKAIHDLLYRPFQEPDDTILESILGSLDSALSELVHLLNCSAGKVDRHNSLQAVLNRSADLAREICGECVPRTYAPALKGLMDEIQEKARRLGSSGSGHNR